MIKVVDSFTLEYLRQVIGKVIKQDNNYYARLLEVDYKNIDDAIAKPLSWVLFDAKRMDDSVEAIRKSKNDFMAMDEKHLQKLIQKVIDNLKKHLSIGADFYCDLSLEKNKHF